MAMNPSSIINLRVTLNPPLLEQLNSRVDDAVSKQSSIP